AMIRAGFEEIERLEGILSRHNPAAALGRLNSAGRLADAPPELLVVLREALVMADASGGAFDPTVLPLLRLWERSFAGTGGPPAEVDVGGALDLVDHRGVEIDGGTVTLADPRMAVTLDGIAKGFVVDRTVEVLGARGAERVLVDAGGDMATDDRASVREPWTVAIQDPHRL
ncbi:MAG: FAD:protein FMN transferase, partial [Gemmatimonadetes bacterium]|nr:FAD:protein FMN transferase [Gemmatimonadota bacterium]NIR34884.1 FAD:protein FMN transferase [Actinomycetota bacterium]NIU72484.1 FAD:protein FMN transferase [Gammaproteobacteria bacterium]NIT86452.1 FAD:protein FMN transferase [Gemmatimonadota bacterium]NIY07111.1 FAD:protein FMN transferase [Gemmatimonadota bacterium]